MFAKIAGFELRYQFRNPVFWVATILFFLLTFGAATSDDIQIGGGGNIHVNSPLAIVQTQLILTLFYMFVTTAFVSNVIVRDEESGFGPMVRSTRVSKFDYLIGRFAGSLLAALAAFLVVPLAIWLGSLMPWVDGETLGPNRIGDYAAAYLAFALPNIVMTSALFFAIATVTRSMMYTYVAVVLFLVLYIVFTAVVGSQPELRDFAGFAEPFGLAALFETTRYWTAAESNTQVPTLGGMILWNRLIWLGFALLALAFAYWRFRFGEKGLSQRKAKKEAKLAAGDPVIVDRLPALDPARAGWARLFVRTRFEMGQVFRSPAFFVLLLIGLFNAGSALYFGNELYGTPARPVTFALIQPLFGSFLLIPIIIAIYYGGELVWRDRERKMHEIVDSTSVPGWSYMVPKTIAVALVLLTTLLISVVAAMLIQLIRGYADFELGKYFAWYILPMSVDMVILAVLAVFIQALSPNKYVGWGIMVVYLVATIVLSSMGFEHPLYLYGSTGSNPVSDINGADVGWAMGWWLRLYWGAFALVLAVLAHLLWRRGADGALMPRLRSLPRRLVSPAGALLGAALLVAAGSGAFLFNQMNVVEEYRTQDDNEAQLAAYEKKYLKYENLAQPALTDVTMRVDLYPNEGRMVARGRYALVNDTDAPIAQLHVRLPDPNAEILDITVPGARLAMNDAENRYRIYEFAEPLAPGATADLTFETRRWQRGFRTTGNDTRLVRNGTFLNNGEFAPVIGMDRSGLLQDRATRRKYDLPAELRPAKLEDESARDRNYVGNADWVTADITISTVPGQTPIAPGVRVSDEVVDGRRVARFVSDSPILSFFSIQSADYALRERMADGVDLQVFYHAAHDFNVDRMLDAMERALGYYRANFGPYQFSHARIVEFPGYASFAQAFAGTMPYSESIGFIADNADEESIDYVTYVTAHEMAHQYWAHQLISADQQGGTIMVETLAQYSALMVMKELYGEDKIRRFLKFELDSYLSARGGEVIEELPLERVENQSYIHYRKGSVVMYLLQDRLGEDRVNAMLAGLLDRYRFQGPPYATSRDLVNGFLGLARNERERQLVQDLLQRITLYDLKAESATVRELPDGRFETTLTVAADKFYADGKGKETRARLDDVIEIGLFTARPGQGAFDRDNVLFMERRPIRSGEQTIRVITEERPSYAGIDPYNKYIDRNSDDNIAETN
ncbi:M1 family aminopeptidase [Pelagerythrobacter sp.]|uniref:ABC transporter permease/M1 family aminopeptidase n=1 Tax=Pelagerythrobacter sp. TaxID=2800702 RepID=UPI0035B0B820